jgi:hypothetical protein
MRVRKLGGPQQIHRAVQLLIQQSDGVDKLLMRSGERRRFVSQSCDALL